MVSTLQAEATRLLALAAKASPGPWRKRDHPRGEQHGCIVEGPRAPGMPYALDVMGDDYTGYGDNEQRARDVAFIAEAHSMADLIRRMTEELR